LDTARVIKDVKPDIIALGYDQEDLAELVSKEVKSAKVVLLKKYGNVSSSAIRKIVYSSEEHNH
jgi:glycerol-3-phosphate cytidylyltransferase-like family protein